MSRLRLPFAILLGLTAPGMGIALLFDAYEGFALFLCFRFFTVLTGNGFIDFASVKIDTPTASAVSPVIGYLVPWMLV